MPHVTYACSCLNVNLHIANKYYLEGHESFRKGKFIRLTNPPLSGWQFDLSIEGVTVEYKNLIRMRKHEDWITVSCHCKTGDVYSVKRPNTTIIEYPIDTSLLYQLNDRVIIHQHTIFGAEIDNLKKNSTYSTTFHIVLNPDLPIHHEPLDKDDTFYGPELNKQYKDLKQVLKKSLIELEEATEQRIQAYQAEQEILLVREKEKAMYDGAILWQAMKEMAITMQDEQRRRQSTQPSSDIMPRLEEPAEMLEQRRRSSVIRRELLGGQPFYHHQRRPSYVLDESAIANSFKNTFLQHPLEVVPEQSMHPTDTGTSREDEEALTSENQDESDDLFELDEDIPAHVPRRPSIKYISSDEEESEDLQVLPIESTFATSVPIHVPFTEIQRATSVTTDRRKSFIGFDYAAADRRQSLNFSPMKKVTDTPHEDGPMVPPHLLTTSNEIEDVFGSVPRNSVR